MTAHDRRARTDGLLRPHACGLPLTPGAGFCAGHEADRVRLGGARR